MKIKSVLTATAHEFNNINAVVQMLSKFTEGEEMLLDEAFQDYGVPTVDVIRDGLIYLRDLIEVEEDKCPKMY